jgi:hypothetical protein
MADLHFKVTMPPSVMSVLGAGWWSRSDGADGVDVDAHAGNRCLRANVITLDGQRQMLQALELLLVSVHGAGGVTMVKHHPEAVIVGWTSPLEVRHYN